MRGAFSRNVRYLVSRSAYIGADLKTRLKPDAMSGLQFEGKLIALPWTLAPAGFWYNKAVMAKAGLDAEKPPQTIRDGGDARRGAICPRENREWIAYRAGAEESAGEDGRDRDPGGDRA